MEYIRQKQCIEKLPHNSLWYDEKVVFFIAYIDTHQKNSCLSEIYAKQRFCLEILSWSQRSGNKNTPPPFNDKSDNAEFISWALYNLLMKVPKQKNTSEKFIHNAEAYLEPCQISTMGLTCFHQKAPSQIFDWVLNMPL